jgi:diaminobutyrate-2-oxoglutarate transaminase
MNIFDELESNVRGYCRDFPTVFTEASGSRLIDEDGKSYIDFLSGAGTLNYGHNNPVLKKRLIDYIERDGIVHGLDMFTTAKRAFIETFAEVVLLPRRMDYKLQFTGPTGANAVEAALKLARKVTGRHNVIAFTNAFHGVTLGALSATGGAHYRNAAGVVPTGVSRMPYAGYMGPAVDTVEYLDKTLGDESSGVDYPAAVIVETVQGEGGLNVASIDWLQALEDICRRREILLIVDDIQSGCGRTGDFFSFEEAGISPSIITLSKSLSGYGMPFSIVLMDPDLDVWLPGEHNGTFRGNNLAFVTAAAALDEYWRDDRLANNVRRKGDMAWAFLEGLVDVHEEADLDVRGRGLMLGLACGKQQLAKEICSRAFDHNLLIERSGANQEVVKFLPPLNIPDEELMTGLKIVDSCLSSALSEPAVRREVLGGPQ